MTTIPNARGANTATGEITFRDATEADVPVLVALVNACYRGEGSKQGWTTEAELLDGQRMDAQNMSDLLRRDDTLILVGEIDDAIVTCCELRRDDEGAYFGMFSVRPELQGAGLGRVVLAEAEQWAVRTWGSRRMRMNVLRQRPELIAWYERRGYTGTGRTEPFPYGSEVFGLPRRDDLIFVELSRELPL
ncbi:GNAT family N-acetyltransferase [Nocardiopsis sp. MG754419]|uniref:GNAT family N-acetyltransferase n=1 Tax=Nocardiopsis sp. MG754419 TaxID=2259865 RepID=UPI001BA4DC89|nr:GNAT family N-acetyltransferase [Nocardiopsis sp. MG754419]MBR8743904.1 GNAT family N-acetyltransferase [Nocardiopsis sp. MG754419]